MRIMASLTLAIAASVSVPVWAMDYQPLSAASVSSSDARVRLAGVAAAPRGMRAANAMAHGKRYNAHRRTVSTNPIVQGNGLIITDFKPDDHHLYASHDYLPPKTDDLAFAETNVAPIKLHKVGFTSVVASVKYRF